MTKPKNVYDSTGFFVWSPYEEQTRRKHQIVSSYFDLWIKILGRWSSLNCFDCFGGCGAYGDVDHPAYGSPILEAQCIDANRARLNRDVRLIVIENDHDNIENMKIAFERAGTDAHPIYIEDDFDNAINHILDETNLTPSFFFIDPFGLNIRYTTLNRIMQVPKSEMFINFMFNAVNRFLSAGAIERNLTELYGTDKWKTGVMLAGRDRERFLLDLYRAQLKKLGDYVYAYPMSFEEQSRTYYYLFHVTMSSKGCMIMKSVVAAVCDGYLGYRGPTQYTPTLFDSPEARIADAVAFLMKYCVGHTLTYGRLIEELADSTPYLEKELRAAVKQLEPSYVTIKRIPNGLGSKRRKSGVSEQDILIF